MAGTPPPYNARAITERKVYNHLKSFFCSGYKTARFCVKLKSQCVGLQRVNNSIIVGTMDDTLSSYNNKVNSTLSLNQINPFTR